MGKKQKKLVLDKNTVKNIKVKTQIKTGDSGETASCGNSYSKYCVTSAPSSGISDSNHPIE